MIFSDLIFVFAFLPIYFALSFSCREPWTKNFFAVAASLLFIVWGRQWYYALIIIPVFLIYLIGLLLKKRKSVLLCAVGVLPALGYTVAAAAALGRDLTLSSALLSVGVILFFQRAVSYFKEIFEGAAPEKDFSALAAYLISFENMLIAPLSQYKTAEARFKTRRPALSKMTEGLGSFITGFAETAVFGLSIDKIRLAAINGEAFPWMNAICLAVSIFCEVYVISSGVLMMSRGLGLMNGLSPEGQISAFIPKRRISDHVYEMWGSLPAFVKSTLSQGNNVFGLIALPVLTGVFLGAGAGAGAFFWIILLAIAFEQIFPYRSKVSEWLFSGFMYIAAFMVLIADSAGGIIKFFSAFDTAKYDFDITFALNDELSRSFPLLILGVLAVSPLGRLAAVAIRQKKAESIDFYCAAKVVETIFCGVLLILGVMASL